MNNLDPLFNANLKEKANNELQQSINGMYELMDLRGYGLAVDCNDILHLKNFSFEQVDSDIRSGDGADMDMTFKATDKSSGQFVYLKFFGEYSSWDSHYWNKTPKVVYPRQRTITEYVELKELEK